MNKKAFTGLFLLIVLGAAAFRLADLALRPVHHDEANQALKFGALLEKGEYRYDKSDHHGPSLYYLTIPFARVFGQDTLAELDERTLRLVPACFGIGTVLLLLLFTPIVGRKTVLGSALGLSVSPVMVYFSRFYIQETLLLFFLAAALAFLWRYLLRPSWGWAAATGLFCGMMYATKETSVIAFGSIAAALIFAYLMRAKREKESAQIDPRSRKANPRFPWAHLVLGIGSALIVSLLLFSSFLQNPRGLLDSLLSFKVYFVRAGEGGFHVHPWHYYIKTLAYFRVGPGPMWSEAFILLLAVIGATAAFLRRPQGQGRSLFRRFILFYTLFSTAAYSLIPYKTPWNILPFYIGFILLAGMGVSFLLDSCRKPLCRTALLVLLIAGFLQLGVQAYRGSFIEPADPRNPYVYAQTSPDFLKLVRRVEDLAALHPDGKRMLIKVIAGPYETWPLPWYLRRFSRVGYWTDAGAAGGPGEADVIITDTEQGGRLEPLLNGSFLSEFYGLRPNVFLVVHIRSDLWGEFLKSHAGKT
jgi:uncharacterized protein (TIGR03663 family)